MTRALRTGKTKVCSKQPQPHYAEVKAIASGNPMVIEKARIDAEIARPSRLHSEHQETNYKLRSRVRHLTDELPRLDCFLFHCRSRPDAPAGPHY